MSNYAPNTGTVNQRPNRISRFVSTILDSPDLLSRFLMILTVYVLIMLPSIFVLLQWISEVFNGPAEIDVASYLFEAFVIAVVFLFGVMLIYGIVYRRPQLYVAIFFISFTLVVMGAWMLGEISNKCIFDLGCDPAKYFVGVMMVGVVTFMGYLLPRLLRQTMPLLGLAFVVIAFTQSDMLLYNAFQRPGIEPTGGAIRALFLLFYSMIWMGLFLSGMRREEPKNRDPYTWE